MIFHLIPFIATLTFPVQHSAYAQDLPHQPTPRCNDFLTPMYGNQILVFSPLAHKHIQNHSISWLAQKLRNRQIAIDFKTKNYRGDAYRMQAQMLEHIVREIFPPTSVPSRLTLKIEVQAKDNALKGRVKNDVLTDFEMSLLKSGNPFIAPLSKKQIRMELGIPIDAKIAAFYGDSEYDFVKAFSAISNKPKLLILSTKGILFREDFLHEKFPDYDLIELTEFEAQKNHDVLNHPTIILNNTKMRMMEMYAASDYAVVIGSNNIFEPLQVSCPTIYFKNSPNGTWVEGHENKILNGYDPQTWKIISSTASQTRGAIGIVNFSELSGAIEEINKIPPKNILHPAFVTPEWRSQSRFDDLLDQLKSLVEYKLRRVSPGKDE